LKLNINERDGLISAMSSHNLALMERVKELAIRIEKHTFENKYIDKLREELYNSCK
jgi:hypothetical protein